VSRKSGYRFCDSTVAFADAIWASEAQKRQLKCKQARLQVGNQSANKKRHAKTKGLEHDNEFKAK